MEPRSLALAVFALMGLLFAGFHGHYLAQAREKGLSSGASAPCSGSAAGHHLTDSHTREIHEVNPRFARSSATPAPS
jgi:hypothetical protein